MIKFVLLFSLLVVCSPFAQVVDIPAPGSGGMHSNGDLQPGEMSYALNIDAWSTPGQLKRRKGLQGYGAIHEDLTGFTSIYQFGTGHKALVAIGDSVRIYYDSDDAVLNKVGQFFISDTFATTIDNGVSGFAFPYKNGHHDWTTWEYGLIHCDGINLPSAISLYDGVKVNDSTQDSVAYAPRAFPIGLPAPGQLLVGNSGFTGDLHGWYEYAYAFLDTVGADFTSGLSMPTAPIKLDGQCAYLTQFDACTNDTTPVIICRREVGGRDEWQVLDTVFQKVSGAAIKHTVNTLSYRFGADGSTKYPILSFNYGFIARGPAGDTIDYALFESPADVAGFTALWGGGYDAVYWMDSLADSLVTAWNTLGVCTDSGMYANRVGIDFIIHDTITASADNVTIYNWRDGNPIGHNYHQYVFYDTVSGTSRPIVYLDTLDDISSPTIFDLSKVSDTIMLPGQLHVDSLTAVIHARIIDTAITCVGAICDTTIDTLTGFHAYDDSTYYLAYSYYDPLTGLESPRGPAIAAQIVDSLDADSCRFLSVTTGIPATGRFNFIRLWQTCTNEIIAGAGDSLVWHGLYDIRHEDTSQTIIWGNWTDVDAAAGIYPDSVTVATIYDYQLAMNAAGDALRQPPYVWDNQIPFEDMEYCYDRFWAIYDNRVYYSAINNPADWNPFNFLRIDEQTDDKTVALKEVNGQLYIFQQRSIWTVAGSDPRYDGYAVPYLIGVGAVSYEAVAKCRSDIYFLTPDAELWSLRNGELSFPVDDYMDTLFDASGKATLSKLESVARVVPFNDGVKVVNDSTGLCATYHIDPAAWTMEKFSGFIPMGSFYYDSSSTTAGFGSSHVLWDDSDTLQLMREFETDTRHDGLGTTAWAAEFYVTGGVGGYWKMVALQARLKAVDDRNYLRYALIVDGDSVATDSIYTADGSSWQTLWWSLKANQGTDLRIKLFAPVHDSVYHYVGLSQVNDSCYDNWTIDVLRFFFEDQGLPVLEGKGDTTYEAAGSGT